MIPLILLILKKTVPPKYTGSYVNIARGADFTSKGYAAVSGSMKAGFGLSLLCNHIAQLLSLQHHFLIC